MPKCDIPAPKHASSSTVIEQTTRTIERDSTAKSIILFWPAVHVHSAPEGTRINPSTGDGQPDYCSSIGVALKSPMTNQGALIGCNSVPNWNNFDTLMSVMPTSDVK
eukprot:4720076-Pyramimonas_sp.AAC.1